MPEKTAMNMRPIPISTAGFDPGFQQNRQDLLTLIAPIANLTTSAACSGSWTPSRRSIRKLALRRCRVISRRGSSGENDQSKPIDSAGDSAHGEHFLTTRRPPVPTSGW